MYMPEAGQVSKHGDSEWLVVVQVVSKTNIFVLL